MEDLWVKLYDREGPLGHKRPACMLLFVFLGGAFLFTVTPRTKKEFLSAFARAPSSLLFGGVRNTHKHLAFCKTSEEFGQCPSPS